MPVFAYLILDMDSNFKFFSHIIIVILTVLLVGYYFRTNEKNRAREEFYRGSEKLYAAMMYWAEDEKYHLMSDSEKALKFQQTFQYAVEGNFAYSMLSDEEKREVRRTALFAAEVQGGESKRLASLDSPAEPPSQHLEKSFSLE